MISLSIAGGTAENFRGHAIMRFMELCAMYMYHLMMIEANEACHLVALHSAGNDPPEDPGAGSSCGHSAAESAMHMHLS